MQKGGYLEFTCTSKSFPGGTELKSELNFDIEQNK
jgi:hypothetical protein